MEFKKLSLMVITLGLASACSQSRLGMDGRFETAYLLQPVELCANISGPNRGCFSIQVSLNDNYAFVDIVGVQADVAKHRLRVGASVGSSELEQLNIIQGDDIMNDTFKAIPSSFIVVSPKGGRNITEYTEWLIETTTAQNTGTGLVPLPVKLGAGIPVVYDFVTYYDLSAVMAQLGWKSL